MASLAPIKNTAYTVASGLSVTNASGATQTVANGYIVDRTPLSGTITAATNAGLYTTGTTAHGLSVGDVVTITGVSSGSSNYTALSGTFVVQTVPSSVTFTVTTATTPTGTVTVVSNANFTTADIAVTGGTKDLVTTAANYQRYDLVAIDLTTLAIATPSTANGLKGTEVASTATPTVPAPVDAARYLVLAAVLVSSTDGSTVVTGPPIDVRNSAQYLPVRAFNRSQNVRIGGVKITANNDAFINIEDSKARKELAYHSAIGAVYVTGPVTQYPVDNVVHNGGVVTTVAASSTVPNISSGDVLNKVTDTYTSFSANATVLLPSGATQTALTTTQFPASGTANYSINYIVVVNKVTGVLSVLSGAVASYTGTQTTQTLTAAQKELYVPLAVATVDNTPLVKSIRDIRPRQ